MIKTANFIGVIILSVLLFSSMTYVESKSNPLGKNLSRRIGIQSGSDSIPGEKIVDDEMGFGGWMDVEGIWVGRSGDNITICLEWYQELPDQSYAFWWP